MTILAKMRKHAVAMAICAGLTSTIIYAGEQAAPAGGAAPATTPAGRSAQELMGELNAASQDLGRVMGNDPQALFDAKKREELAPKAIPAIKRVAGLLNEMAAANPQAAGSIRQMRLQFDAILALFNDPEGVSALEKGAASAEPREAAIHKGMQLLVRWWKSGGNAAEQSAVLDDFQALAKQYPEDDSLPQVLLAMKEQNAANNEIRAKAESIVLNDMKGAVAKHIAPQIQAQQKLRGMEGKPLTVEGVKLDGTKLSTADWKNKVVLVVFWASSDEDSVKLQGQLKKLFADNHAKGLEIVGVANDEKAADLTAFIVKNPEMAWPQLFDATKPGIHPLVRELGVTRIPLVMAIDRKGNVRSVDAGDKLNDLVPQLLAEKAE